MRFQQAYDPFRAVSETWRLVCREPAVLLVGGLLLAILTDGDRAWEVSERWDGEMRVDWDAIPGLIVLAAVGSACLAWQLITFLMAAFLQTTLPYALERVLRDGNTQFADLMTTRGRFLSVVLSSVLAVLAVAASMIPSVVVFFAVGGLASLFGMESLAVLGGVAVALLSIPILVYVGLGVYLTPQAAAVEGLAPVDALKRSWALVDGNRVWLLFYMVVLYVFAALGILLCCVGVFGTSAMRVVAINESYLRLVHSDDEQNGWWVVRGDLRPPAPETPAGERSEPTPE